MSERLRDVGGEAPSCWCTANLNAGYVPRAQLLDLLVEVRVLGQGPRTVCRCAQPPFGSNQRTPPYDGVSHQVQKEHLVLERGVEEACRFTLFVSTGDLPGVLARLLVGKVPENITAGFNKFLGSFQNRAGHLNGIVLGTSRRLTLTDLMNVPGALTGTFPRKYLS